MIDVEFEISEDLGTTDGIGLKIMLSGGGLGKFAQNFRGELAPPESKPYITDRGWAAIVGREIWPRPVFLP